jgi:hypothetical protein
MMRVLACFFFGHRWSVPHVSGYHAVRRCGCCGGVEIS